MPEFAKINRKIFAKEMPEKLKQYFIFVIQKHPTLPQKEKDFVSDFLNNYESISDENRNDVMDVIDGLGLFIRGEPIKANTLG
jgi:hypothetical protein